RSPDAAPQRELLRLSAPHHRAHSEGAVRRREHQRRADERQGHLLLFGRRARAAAHAPRVSLRRVHAFVPAAPGQAQQGRPESDDERPSHETTSASRVSSRTGTSFGGLGSPLRGSRKRGRSTNTSAGTTTSAATREAKIDSPTRSPKKRTG